MNQQFLNILIIIALGYLLKRLNILQEKDGEVISKIIFKITLPALVIVSLSKVKIEPSLIALPVIVIIYGLLMAIAAFLFFKNEEKELKGTIMMLTPGLNVGLFAFPLVHAIWGEEALTYFGMFDVGTSITVFGIAYILGSYFSEEGLSIKPAAILKKLGQSIPLMTYLVAVLLNFTNIHLPEMIIDVAEILSKANMPLSLLLLGLYMNFNFEKEWVRPIFKFLAFRYSLGLLFALSCYFLLPFEQMIRTAILIGLLLPIPGSILPFAVEFKYRTTQLIATLSNLTIIIGIIIIYVFANFIL